MTTIWIRNIGTTSYALAVEQIATAGENQEYVEWVFRFKNAFEIMDNKLLLKQEHGILDSQLPRKQTTVCAAKQFQISQQKIQC